MNHLESRAPVLRMLRCTFCETALGSKTGITRQEAARFWNEHEKTDFHPGTIQATRVSPDGSVMVGALEPSDR